MLRPAAAFALALTLPVLAQTAPPPTPHKQVPILYGKLSGTVFCADTRRPARGASVMLVPVPSADGKRALSDHGITRTALDGTYVLRHVIVGEYAVIAFYPGYTSGLGNEAFNDMDKDGATQRDALRAFGTVTISPDSSATKDVTLQPGTTLSGRVLFSDGTPATEANITVEDVSAKPHAIDKPEELIDPSATMNKMFNHQTNATDDQGNFRISGLIPGTYRVAAVESTSSQGDDSTGGEASFFSLLVGVNMDQTALRVYAGDTFHTKDAKQFELRSGDSLTGINITIPLGAFHKVRGTFLALDGRQLTNATLTLSDTTDDAFTYHTELHHDGTFEFPNVPSGTYTITATGGTINSPSPSSPGGFAQPTNAFDKATTSVIVKDSDVDDVALTSKEVPLPKPSPNTPEDDE